MSDKSIFFSRCRPNKVDILEISKTTKRIFIGYPFLMPGKTYKPDNLKSCIVNLKCKDDKIWKNFIEKSTSTNKSQYSKNRNLVDKISIGSIALIPRPSDGVIYAGIIKSQFELVNSPPWYTQYLEMRAKNSDENNPDFMHAADVAQCWEVDEFREIPFTKFPRWLLGSLNGRSTYGVIPERVENSYDKISLILSTDGYRPRDWTLDKNEIENRLKDDMSPSSFEHLMVSLLQLENKDDIWWHTGGSGDGGLDGIGANARGEVTGILQCKLHLNSKTSSLDDEILDQYRNKKRFLASIFYNDTFVQKFENIEFLGLPQISELLIRHYKNLPQAISMRIGSANWVS